ncbi:MAG: hypothetical protein HY619_00090 [Thaumarchaeota archaeon]|nr:hypothetical protein [Nitrososphaerota archaeon]
MISATETLSKLLSSEIKGDLLVLFHKNPGLIDTINGVARRIGTRSSAIEADVRDFVEIGLLKRKQIGTHETISIDHAKDKEVQETIGNYLRNLKKDER